MQIHEAVRGQLVRLVLGATIDTQLGPRSRPRKFVADEKGPDGRRAVPADLDDDGNERAPLLFKVLGVSRRGRGDNLVEIEGPDLARGEALLDLLEIAGPPPVQDAGGEALDGAGEPRGQLAAYVARAVDEACAKAFAPLGSRLAALQNDIDAVAKQCNDIVHNDRAQDDRSKNAAARADAVAAQLDVFRTQLSALESGLLEHIENDPRHGKAEKADAKG